VTVLLVAAALALVSATATGGYGSVEADRGLDVSVAADDRAYLGVDSTDRSVPAGGATDVTVLTLENRFADRLGSIDVAVGGDDPTPPVAQTTTGPAELRAGESGGVTVTVACDNGTASHRTETWTVTVVAAGQGAAVELARSVDITCEPAALSSTPGPGNWTATAVPPPAAATGKG